MIPNDWPAPMGFALETTIGVTVLVLLVLALRRPVAKRFGAGAAYALWLLPLIRLVLPPLPSGWVFRPILAGSSGEAVPLPPVPPPPGTTENAVAFIVRAKETSTPTIEEFAAPIAEISTASPLNWPLILATVWLVGAGIAFAVSVHRHRNFMQVVDGEAEDACASLQEMAAETAAEIGLKRPVRVCSSYIPDGPMVTGLTRPIVLLPAWFEEDYSPTEQRAAIAHELTHVKRRDLWALQFANAAMALQWFNPFAYLALRAFRSDQEAACDADVLRSTAMTPRAYGGALVKAVKLSHSNRTRMMAAGLPLNHAVKDRLLLMQAPAPSFAKRLFGGSMVGIIGALAMFATASAQGPSKDITIENGKLTLDGKTYSDRRFVLLDEPFQRNQFHFEFDGDTDFDFDFDFDFDNMVGEFGDMAFMANINIDGEELSEIVDLSELSQLLPEIIPGIEVTTLDDGSTQIIIEKTDLQFPESVEKIEAWADRIEAHAEAYAARVEARAEAYAERAEAMAERAEARAEVFEKKMELRAKLMEERADAYAHKMEIAHAHSSEAIGALAEACASERFSEGRPIVLEHEVDGEPVKALCIKGETFGESNSEEVKRFLEDISGLSKDERKLALKQLTRKNYKTSYRFELQGGPED